MRTIYEEYKLTRPRLLNSVICRLQAGGVFIPALFSC